MRSSIGDACQPGKAPRGTCSGDETVCVTDGQLGFPGGVCTQDCVNTACPDDAVCVLPVCVDDTDAATARVPDKFKALHFTRLPGGEASPEFVRRLQALLASRRA